MIEFIDFDAFLLPQARIATRPRKRREQANLLSCLELSCLELSCLELSCLEDAPKDLRIEDLPSLLKRGDVVVLNDTKVLPAIMQARILVRRVEAAPFEVTLVEVTLAERIESNLFRAFVKGKIQEHARLQFGDASQPFFAQLEGRDTDGLLRLRFEGIAEETLYDRLEAEGAMPLPPYMKRKPDAKDKQDYQTLFARNRGAFAAPTACRHLTPRLLKELQREGIETLFITLHVSFGSFRPLCNDERKASRQEVSQEVSMARESVVVSAEVAARIQACKQRGGRVLAVGTTVVRALEAAALHATEDGAFCGETDLFIAEGFPFRCCDLLLTNFHQARATPLLLTCAFAGEEMVKRAYAHARTHEHYRFFSYGDACLFARRATG